jgi:hypothetical protein
MREYRTQFPALEGGDRRLTHPTLVRHEVLFVQHRVGHGSVPVPADGASACRAAVARQGTPANGCSRMAALP